MLIPYVVGARPWLIVNIPAAEVICSLPTNVGTWVSDGKSGHEAGIKVLGLSTVNSSDAGIGPAKLVTVSFLSFDLNKSPRKAEAAKRRG